MMHLGHNHLMNLLTRTNLYLMVVFLVSLKGNHLPSIILWGPPGTGKTSFARILAKDYGYDLIELSGVNSGVSDIRSHSKRRKEKR